MGSSIPCLCRHDTVARLPNDMFARSPSNISLNPSEVIYEVSKKYVWCERIGLFLKSLVKNLSNYIYLNTKYMASIPLLMYYITVAWLIINYNNDVSFIAT